MGSRSRKTLQFLLAAWVIAWGMWAYYMPCQRDATTGATDPYRDVYPVDMSE